MAFGDFAAGMGSANYGVQDAVDEMARQRSNNIANEQNASTVRQQQQTEQAGDAMGNAVIPTADSFGAPAGATVPGASVVQSTSTPVPVSPAAANQIPTRQSAYPAGYSQGLPDKTGAQPAPGGGMTPDLSSPTVNAQAALLAKLRGTPVTSAPTTSTPTTAPAATPTGNPVQDLHSAVVMAESGGNPNAVSPTGAYGRYQVLPSTAAKPGFGIMPVADNSPAEADRVGASLLNKYNDIYGGHQVPMLVAYKEGAGFANQWIAAGAKWDDLPARTQAYINSVDKHLGGSTPGPITGAQLPINQVASMGSSVGAPATAAQPSGSGNIAPGNYDLGVGGQTLETAQLDQNIARIQSALPNMQGSARLPYIAQLQELQAQREQVGMLQTASAAGNGDPQAMGALAQIYRNFTRQQVTFAPTSDGNWVMATQGKDGQLQPASQPMSAAQLSSQVLQSVNPAMRNRQIQLAYESALAQAKYSGEGASNERIENTRANAEVLGKMIEGNTMFKTVLAREGLNLSQIKVEQDPLRPGYKTVYRLDGTQLGDIAPGESGHGVESSPTFQPFAGVKIPGPARYGDLYAQSLQH